MKLGIRILHGYSASNYWSSYQTQESFTYGNPQTITFQVVDSTLDNNGDGWPGRRYCPINASPTLSVTLLSNDAAVQVIKVCTQPVVGDSSLWQFQMLSTDLLVGTVSATLQLQDGANIYYGLVPAMLNIEPTQMLASPTSPSYTSSNLPTWTSGNV